MIKASAPSSEALAHRESSRLARDFRNIDTHSNVTSIQFFKVEPTGFERIISGHGLAADPSTEDRDEHVMEARRSIVCRHNNIDSREHSVRSCLDAGLL